MGAALDHLAVVVEVAVVVDAIELQKAVLRRDDSARLFAMHTSPERAIFSVLQALIRAA